MSPGLLTRSGENRLPSANLTHFWRGLKVWLLIGVALWQAAWEVPDLVPGNKLVQKRGKEENNLLHIEPAKSQLGNISQAGNHLPGMSSPGPPLTFLLNWSQKPTPRHLGRVQGVERSALLLLCDPPGRENAPVQPSHILSGLGRVWGQLGGTGAVTHPWGHPTLSLDHGRGALAVSWGWVPGSNSALGVFFPTTMQRAQLEHWRQRAGLQSRELVQDSCESCSPERQKSEHPFQAAGEEQK